MKSNFLSSCRSRVAPWGLLLGCAVLCADSVRAANPVINGTFDNPLGFGTAPWSIVYVRGGPDDFAIKDRTTAARRGGTGYGAAFKPYHDSKMHAYFKQTVPGLTPGGSYAVTTWMNNPVTPKPDGFYVSFSMYLETVGGLGSVTSAAPTNEGYQAYIVTNTATANGEIDIRLHFDKFNFTLDKWYYMDVWFDDVSMALVSSPLPSYKILSLSLANQTATIQWETVSNQVYRIEATSDLSTSNWTTFQDNLLATGTNLTFTTNVMVSPQYFRIHRL
jgi:hypothetical protein